MKSSKTLVVLCGVIIVLSLIAALMGIFWQDAGSSYAFKTLRGETVMIYGQGLYKFDTVSLASQGIAQDVVTLIMGIPLLIVALVLSQHGSLRGQLLLTGTLGYFLYTYASYSFTSAYNNLFLVYVTLFSIALFATLLSVKAIDVAKLPLQFSPNLPRRAIATFCFFVGTALLMMWLGRIAPSLTKGTPPAGLDSYATLVIQALDLGVIVPLAFVSGILLLRKNAWGYLLTSVILLKGFTMLVALTAMIIGQLIVGAQMSVVEVIMFPLIGLINIGMTYLLLKHISAKPALALN